MATETTAEVEGTKTSSDEGILSVMLSTCREDCDRQHCGVLLSASGHRLHHTAEADRAMGE